VTAKQLTFAAFALAAFAARAQVCNERIAFATPTARFVDNRDGTVLDRRTGLTWQRCPLGFTFDDGATPDLQHDDRCLPPAAAGLTWHAALQAAVALNQAGGFAGYTDWRLPNMKELASIAETRCSAPSANLLVFPGTPAQPFWSSTFQVGPPTFTNVQTVDFGTGGDRNVRATALAQARLVR
jgi:hypothetical protein